MDPSRLILLHRWEASQPVWPIWLTSMGFGLVGGRSRFMWSCGFRIPEDEYEALANCQGRVRAIYLTVLSTQGGLKVGVEGQHRKPRNECQGRCSKEDWVKRSFWEDAPG